MSTRIRVTSVRLPPVFPVINSLTHSACDGETKSEIVIPLREGDASEVVGVLDVDSTALGTFDDDDMAGLKRVAEILLDACDWA